MTGAQEWLQPNQNETVLWVLVLCFIFSMGRCMSSYCMVLTEREESETINKEFILNFLNSNFSVF